MTHPQSKTAQRQSIRTELFFAQRGLCYYCNRPMLLASVPTGATIPDNLVTLEHIVPQCEGGPTDRANSAAACRKCNSDRGNGDARLFMLAKMGLS